jgi:hypothetical protein
MPKLAREYRNASHEGSANTKNVNVHAFRSLATVGLWTVADRSLGEGVNG